MNKYRAIKTKVGDITFDSKAEARRYSQLLWMNKAGVIRNLELQPKFVFHHNGKKIFEYRADFAYFEGERRIIEDVKGVRTPVYRLKKKLVEAHWNVTIQEIAA